MAPDYKKVPDYKKKVPESDKKYLKKAGGHIGQNVVQITMMRTIVRIILIIKPHLKNSEEYFILSSNVNVLRTNI